MPPEFPKGRVGIACGVGLPAPLDSSPYFHLPPWIINLLRLCCAQALASPIPPKYSPSIDLNVVDPLRGCIFLMSLNSIAERGRRNCSRRKSERRAADMHPCASLLLFLRLMHLLSALVPAFCRCQRQTSRTESVAHHWQWKPYFSSSWQIPAMKRKSLSNPVYSGRTLLICRHETSLPLKALIYNQTITATNPISSEEAIFWTRDVRFGKLAKCYYSRQADTNSVWQKPKWFSWPISTTNARTSCLWSILGW